MRGALPQDEGEYGYHRLAQGWVRNSKWGAVQRQRLTVQWNGRLDLGAVIMTLRDTPEFVGDKKS